jgi:hypothetical protein
MIFTVVTHTERNRHRDRKTNVDQLSGRFSDSNKEIDKNGML